MQIVRYSPDLQPQWDSAVKSSKNGTFLHLRDYMDYHSDRFADHSLLLCDDKGNILACLPACIEGCTLYSHRGLTYGGWIIPSKHFTTATMLDCWQLMNEYLLRHGISTLVYKPSPHIYHSYPAEEDLYTLFRYNATLSASLVSSAIDLDSPLPFNENSRRNLKKALAAGIVISTSTDYAEYWNILTRLLCDRYNTSPVHSLDEIRLLAERFPNNIRLFTATLHSEIIAGAVIYYTDRVAHAQYIAASPRGKELNALPLLFRHIIDHECRDCRYFDFGTSCEDKGRYLNSGLIAQKCGMGGRAIVYNEYTVEIP